MTIPTGITEIGESAFSMCTNLISVTLPEGLTNIGICAFEHCGLTSIDIPSSVTTIYNYAFGDSNLTSVTFNGTPTVVLEDAFLSCSNLTSIKVPWAEGAVSGAPWGATNATITYNYTGN